MRFYIFLYGSMIFYIDSLGKQQHEHSWNNGAPLPLNFRLSKHSEQHFSSHLGILALEFQDCQKKKREHRERENSCNHLQSFPRDTAQRPRRRRLPWHGGMAWRDTIEVTENLDRSCHFYISTLSFHFLWLWHMSTFHNVHIPCLWHVLFDGNCDRRGRRWSSGSSQAWGRRPILEKIQRFLIVSWSFL